MIAIDADGRAEVIVPITVCALHDTAATDNNARTLSFT